MPLEAQACEPTEAVLASQGAGQELVVGSRQRDQGDEADDAPEPRTMQLMPVSLGRVSAEHG